MPREIDRREFLGRVSFVTGGVWGGLFNPTAAWAAASGAAAEPARMDAILDGAKREGKVLLYSSIAPDANPSVANAFKKKYGIEAEFYRQPPVKMMERVSAELMSNRVLADVLAIDVPLAAALTRDGAFASFDPPERRAIDPKWKKPEYTTVRLYTGALMWNTDLIKGENEPKGWQDLANPKYRGKLGIADPASSNSVIQWTFMVRKLYGVEYLQKLGQNKPRIFEGAPALATAVAAGEVPIGIALEYLAPQYKAKGAPVRGLIPSPTFYGGIDVAVMAKAPHPNAARLFCNFCCSREGQEAICGPLKSITTRHDAEVPGAYKLKDVKEFFSVDFDELNAKTREIQEDFGNYVKGRG